MNIFSIMSAREKRNKTTKMLIEQNMQPITEEQMQEALVYAKRPTEYFVGEHQITKFSYPHYSTHMMADALRHIGIDLAKKLCYSFANELPARWQAKLLDHLLTISVEKYPDICKEQFIDPLHFHEKEAK